MIDSEGGAFGFDCYLASPEFRVFQQPVRGKFATIFRAATEVNRAIFFSAAIIIVGFIPLFTLSGVEGHIFSPMAKTYAYALAGALLATFTVVPAFSAFLLHDRVRETETIIVVTLRRIY